MQHPDRVCCKCGNEDFETDEFRAAGGTFAKNLRCAEQTVHHGELYPLPIH